MEKKPAERYATAQALADDLERFLKDEPIRAKRPTLVQRARKWARRHKPVVWAAVVCLLTAIALLGAGIGWIAGDRAARRTKAAEGLNQALQDAAEFMADGDWPRATAAAQRAAGL